jgi:hypothetical protein
VADDSKHFIMSFNDPLFTANDVFEKFSLVLTKPEFKTSIAKLKVNARAAGGREKSVSLIEEAYIHYAAA